MKYIERRNGYVYLVQEDSNDGRFKTYYNMGKDIDDPMWKNEVESFKSIKKSKKSED